MIRLPVFEHPRIEAYPGDDPPEVLYASLSAILTEQADSDAHFSAYSCPDLPHRLRGAVLSEHPVIMHVLVFDADAPKHKPTEEWREGQRFYIQNSNWPQPFVYETRGGYRLVWRLATPFLIETEEDSKLWSAYYLSNVRYLHRVFDIQADTACADWTRLYRLPHATRDGEVQNLPTYGDPHNVGTWDDSQLIDEDFVEPEPVKARIPREGMHTDPPLPVRKVKALAHVAKMPPSVQGSGAENTLWAVCNAALVGFDLPVEDAAEVIRQAHMPLSTLEGQGPEHFEERMWKKLEELDSDGGREPWGYLLTAERMVSKVSEVAKSAKSTKNVKSATQTIPGGASPQWPDPTEYLARAGEAGAVKLPTPLETLNTMTRGGLRAKTLLVLGGAPGAGKTTLAVQLAGHYLEAGLPVALIAADEAIELLLTRLAQRHGIMREDVEHWRPHAAKRWHEVSADWKLLAVDAESPEATLERVAERLAEQGPGIVIVDSLQTVRSDTSGEADGPRARIDDIVATLKQLNKLYGHASIATSELTRGAYRSKAIADQIDDLAAFKESGGIEYAMTVGLVLRTPPGEGGLVDVSTAKNRLGGGKPKFRLQLDPVRATFREVPMPVEEEEDEAGKRAREVAKLELVKVDVIALVREGGPKKFGSKRQIYLALKGKGSAYRESLVYDAIGILEAELKLFRQGGFYEVA